MSQTAQSWWFVFYKDELLLEKKENGTFALPYGEIPPVFMIEKTTVHDVTTLEGSNCKAFSLARPIEESAKYVLVGLRASYECLPVAHYQASIMKKCPNCGREVYPAISTAILVLVRKGDSILLVHARNFKGSFNSLVAGFLETGETLEECVAREVKEETGLDVKNITYFGNQPWPYPSGLMVGFIADYAEGEITLQDEELSSGDFYTRDHLPELPRKLSLARKMIDWWLDCSNK